MNTQTERPTTGARPLPIVSWRGSAAGALLAAAAAVGCTPPAPPATAAKAPEVDVAEAVRQEVTDYAVFTGSVQAEQSVTLQAQVTGYLLPAPLAREGTDVKKGDHLFKIDPSVYKATLDQAVARTRTAEDTYSRDRASGAIAVPEATVVQDLNALHEAQAAEEFARLNVNFTDIDAPFDGRVSRRNVDPGNLVQANMTALATIVQLDPIYALFDVDERTLLRIRKLVEEGTLPATSIKGNDLPVNLALSDEGMGFTYTQEDVKNAARRAKSSPSEGPEAAAIKVGQPRHPGVIKIVDNQENVQTGTLRMWGEFRNPVAPGSEGHNPAPRLLSPGMFARIQLPIGPPRQAVLINEAALISDQGREMLYVVQPMKDENGKVLVDEKGEKDKSGNPPPRLQAVAHYVTTGPEQNGLRVIESGLQEGEQVVLNGQQRVRDKGEVRIRPKPEGQNQGSGGKGQESGVRGQESGVRGQESGARDQESGKKQ
jgi:membrane fusion protein, multidrug efflux system